MRLLLFNLATDADDPILGFATRWIEALAQRSQHIDVITMRTGRVAVPANVRVYSVGKEKGYSELRRLVEFYRILTDRVSHNHYDACFAHMMQLFAVMAHPILRQQRIPTVLWYSHKSVTPLLHLATRLVDRVVTASEDSFRIASPKVRVTGHGIDTAQFIPGNLSRLKQPDQPFSLLTVGRLSPIKRLEVLIGAIARLRQTHPHLPLVLKIVGSPLIPTDQSYEQDLRSQIQHNHLQEQVHFLGSRSPADVIAAYQQADCFVSLSATGSLDKAVLEAMSCGVPVIATPTYKSVLPENLAQDWIVDWTAEQVCDRISRMISLPPPDRQHMGQQLRQIVVQEHNLEKLCDRLLQELATVASISQPK